MSQRFTVTALDRRSIGHPNYWRAGRSWPSGQEVEVEVLDQDDDPMEETIVRGEKRTHPHPTKIGRVSWAAIQADRQLIKQPIGATPDEALSLQARVDELTRKLAETTTRAELAEHVLTERNQGIDRLHVALKAAQEKLEDIEAMRADAVIKLANSETAVAKLTQERDELAKQVEQLTAPSSAPAAASPSAPATTSKGQGKGQAKRGG